MGQVPCRWNTQWSKCQYLEAGGCDCYQGVQGLVYFAPIWRAYIRQFLEETIADGVSYVEARINFSPK
jgi:hypothetical protein